MVQMLNSSSAVYDLVDEIGRDSFPASDPPSFTPVSGSGAKRPALPAAVFATSLEGVFKEVDLSQLPPTGQVHLVLLEAEAFLSQALREWAAGRASAEAAEVVDRLATLRAYLSEHRANIEAEGSLSDSVKSEAPWLMSHLHRLLRHHDRLDRAITLASAECEEAGAETPPAVRVQQHTKGVAAALMTLIAVERWLLMDQFCEPQALD
jgi:hypothetical protein